MKTLKEFRWLISTAFTETAAKMLTFYAVRRIWKPCLKAGETTSSKN